MRVPSDHGHDIDVYTCEMFYSLNESTAFLFLQKWRPFCDRYKGKLIDFNFGTLLRLAMCVCVCVCMCVHVCAG